jgi:hypothetical protein
MTATEQNMKPASAPETGLLCAVRTLTEGVGTRSIVRRGTVAAFAAAVCLAFIAAPSAALGVEAHLLERTFGTSASTPANPYPLTDPTDVAVDGSSGSSKGDVYIGNPSADAQQAIDVHGTSGTFTLSFEGQMTKQLSLQEAQPFQIEKALGEFAAIGQGNVSVEEVFPAKHSATVTFAGKFSEKDVEQLKCTGTGGASCTVTTTVQAAAGSDVEKFSPSGGLLLMFGANVNKTAVEAARPESERNVCPAPGNPSDVCQLGTRGHKPGQLEGETEWERGRDRDRVRESRLFLAVDDGAGGEGDVYVADPGDHTITKFKASGEVERAWGSEGDGQLGGLFTSGVFGGETFEGIAVDRAGNLIVGGPQAQEVGGVKGADIREFDREGKQLKGSFESTSLQGNPGLAVDPDENLFAGASVDPESGDHYLLQTREDGLIERFAFGCHGEEVETEPCSSLEEFGFGDLSRPEDVAAGPGGVVYVANTGEADVAVFGNQSIEAPTASIEAPSEISYTTAHVAGQVNPHGQATSCRFQYVSDAHFKAEGFAARTFKTEAELRKAEEEGYERPQYQPCASSPGSGSSNLPVEARLGELTPGTSYHARLIARGRLGAIVSSAEPNESFKTEAVVAPSVNIEAPRGVLSTSATFKGQIDPNAPEAAPSSAAVEAGFKVKWSFQCTPARAVSPPCKGELSGTLAADDVGHEVSAQAGGLQPGEAYEVKLLGANAGLKAEAPGAGLPPLRFTAPAIAPRIDATTVSGANESEATLSAQIDPGGAPTTYRFQYIGEPQYQTDGEQFGEGTLETAVSGPIGVAGDNVDKEASATIAGLTPESSYRYRVVAQNGIGPTDGPAEGLFTYATTLFSACPANEQLRSEDAATTLPDCRSYERISPANNSTVYSPVPPVDASEGYRNGWYPMQSSSDGEAVSYMGEPASSGEGAGTGNSGGGEGDEELAKRTTLGWVAEDIEPLGSNPATFFEAFSSDLSRGILVTLDGVIGGNSKEKLSPAVETNCAVLYSRASGSGEYSPLYKSESSTCHQPLYVGSSSDGSQSVFESSAKKTPEAQTAEGKGHENIYDSAGGQLHLVNLLPNGKTSADASIGRLASEEESKYAGHEGEISNGQGIHTPAIDTSGAISQDGSRIFWSDLATGILYVRENPSREASAISAGKCTEPELACTVKVSEGAADYQSATPDGRFAYYTEAGRLWRYDVETTSREALTAAGAEVQGVVGVNQAGEDGAYLYLVAAGALSPEAQARKCETAGPSEPQAAEESEGLAPTGRGCNLYVIHEGTTKLVAVLSASDDEFGGKDHSEGDWRATLGMHSAQLTPDGQSLSFLSSRRLTSYRNVVAGGATCQVSYNHHNRSACPEVYVYDASTASVACASCNPTGAAPLANESLTLNGEPATYLPGDFGSITQMRRWISADGSRVFFDTIQPLLAADTNGLQDVYEWERAGSGSCSEGSSFDGGGCLYLLSGGSGDRGSYLTDSDETGANVFFVTRTALLPGESSGASALFDARVDGGFPAAASGNVQLPPCESAEACKSLPGEPPASSFPASAAFSGAENLIAPPEVAKPPAKKPAVRKLTRAQKLAKAMKTCKRESNKARRAECKTLARKRYGPIVVKKTHDKRRKNR